VAGCRCRIHGIEAKLFGANAADVGDKADALIAQLADLDARVRTMKLTPQGLLDGVVRLAYEIATARSMVANRD
jgi:iron uptake system EfeUOB component EfeO/EfeM